MPKRPFPFGFDYQRQIKKHVTESSKNATDSNSMNEVYERTNALLFEGARRAAMQPQVFGGGHPCSSDWGADAGLEESESYMDTEMVTAERSNGLRQTRLDTLIKRERRDPSPMPTNRLRDFSLSQAFPGEGNKDVSESKVYKQPIIQQYLTTQVGFSPLKTVKEDQNRNDWEEEKKDFNGNTSMEF